MRTSEDPRRVRDDRSAAVVQPAPFEEDGRWVARADVRYPLGNNGDAWGPANPPLPDSYGATPEEADGNRARLIQDWHRTTPRKKEVKEKEREQPKRKAKPEKPEAAPEKPSSGGRSGRPKKPRIDDLHGDEERGSRSNPRRLAVADWPLSVVVAIDARNIIIFPQGCGETHQVELQLKRGDAFVFAFHLLHAGASNLTSKIVYALHAYITAQPKYEATTFACGGGSTDNAFVMEDRCIKELRNPKGVRDTLLLPEGESAHTWLSRYGGFVLEGNEQLINEQIAPVLNLTKWVDIQNSADAAGNTDGRQEARGAWVKGWGTALEAVLKPLGVLEREGKKSAKRALGIFALRTHPGKPAQHPHTDFDRAVGDGGL